jgi:hypothetical protein
MNCAVRCTTVLCLILTAGRVAGVARAEPGAERTLAQQTGSFFAPAPRHPSHPPRVTEIPLPDIQGAYAIWGATGRDHRGHIWFGVSVRGVLQPSAHLFEYVPETGDLIDRGDVVGQLRQLGLLRPGEGQMKIHSRIVQADDGYLYFASMDEQGERGDGTRLPTWGSHFWRLRPEEPGWEHLLHVPYGLVAVSGVGRYVYILGYFGHPLIQYDTVTGRFRGAQVGAHGGHVSRNLLSDGRGHVFIPRLVYREVPDPNDRRPNPRLYRKLTSTLLELDAGLKIVAETPLEDYFRGLANDSHGIIAVTYLADGSMAFATHLGRLYRIVPQQGARAKLFPLGWFRPEGSGYAPALFTFEGRRYLVGLAEHKARRFDWLVYDLKTNRSTSVPLALDHVGRPPVESLLLYGSITRDSRGGFYVAGSYINRSGQHPILLRLDSPTAAAFEEGLRGER